MATRCVQKTRRDCHRSATSTSTCWDATRSPYLNRSLGASSGRSETPLTAVANRTFRSIAPQTPSSRPQRSCAVRRPPRTPGSKLAGRETGTAEVPVSGTSKEQERNRTVTRVKVFVRRGARGGGLRSDEDGQAPAVLGVQKETSQCWRHRNLTPRRRTRTQGPTPGRPPRTRGRPPLTRTPSRGIQTRTRPPRTRNRYTVDRRRRTERSIIGPYTATSRGTRRGPAASGSTRPARRDVLGLFEGETMSDDRRGEFVTFRQTNGGLLTVRRDAIVAMLVAADGSASVHLSEIIGAPS